MKKKYIILIATVVLLSATGFFFFQPPGSSKEETRFQFEVLSRGDLKKVISSTGTLNPVGTVEVGSQISGIVNKVLVDYNDNVKKGQILAVVDTSVLEATVYNNRATVAKYEAELNQAKTEYERQKKLFEQGYVSEISLLELKTSVDTATASLNSAESSLKTALTNLKYAEIRSPIDGTVIKRSIDKGQTIAASYSAPTLFTLAEDLSKMQIEATVDETDIGQIKEGQSVMFTVQAYPDETFSGEVRQIRLEPETVQNVVNYTVIVNASNDRGLLLPGMTATVDFLIAECKDALLVPNSALYFQPTQEMMESFQKQVQGMPPAGNNCPPNQNGMGNSNSMPAPWLSQDMSQVFYLDDTGNPRMAWFVAGITDSVQTVVVQSGQLYEGMKVITGSGNNKGTTSKKNNERSAFPGGGRGGPGGPPPF